MTEKVQGSAIIADLLTSGHAVRFRASGHSMYPLIRSEDYLHVEPVPATEVTKGDVVLASAERGLTAHRVMRIKRNPEGALMITMRGDNASDDDAIVWPTQVLGRVTTAERDGRMYRVPRRLVRVRRLATRAMLFLSRLWTAIGR